MITQAKPSSALTSIVIGVFTSALATAAFSETLLMYEDGTTAIGTITGPNTVTADVFPDCKIKFKQSGEEISLVLGSGAFFTQPFSALISNARSATIFSYAQGSWTASNVAVRCAEATSTVSTSGGGTSISDLLNVTFSPTNFARSPEDRTYSFLPLVIDVDTTAPTVELTSNATNPQSGLFTVTATFSEPVSGVELSDFVVSSGVASALTGAAGDTVYTIDVLPSADADSVVVTFPMGRADDIAGNPNSFSTQISISIDQILPSVSLIASEPSSEGGPINVTINFSEEVIGFESADVSITNGVPGVFSGSGDTYALEIFPSASADEVIIYVDAGVATDAAGNANLASTALNVALGVSQETITEVSNAITSDLSRTTTSAVAANATMMSGALGRVASDQSSGSSMSDAVSRSSVQSVSVRPMLDADEERINFGGSFFGQSLSADGVYRRVSFGEFDVQHTYGSGTSLSFNGRIAWERAASENTLIAYFLGAEVNASNIDSSYTGDMNRVGVSIGAYGFQALSDRLFFGSYASFGVSRSEINIRDDDVSHIMGDYLSRIFSFGAQLSGSLDYDAFELRPSASLSYVRTLVGDITLDENGKSFEVPVGNTAFANFTLTPEFLVPLDQSEVGTFTTTALVAPRLLCEMTNASNITTRECGAGITFGIMGASDDGATRLNASIRLDRVGGIERTGVNLQAELRF